MHVIQVVCLLNYMWLSWHQVNINMGFYIYITSVSSMWKQTASDKNILPYTDLTVIWFMMYKEGSLYI